MIIFLSFLSYTASATPPEEDFRKLTPSTALGRLYALM
jgi:hypothetical protein